VTGFVPASRLYDVQTGVPTDRDWNRAELDGELSTAVRTPDRVDRPRLLCSEALDTGPVGREHTRRSFQW
jgi:hypothetical protein